MPIAHEQVGLHAPSLVRMKLFTLDNRLIAKRIGCLLEAERIKVLKTLAACLFGSSDVL